MALFSFLKSKQEQENDNIIQSNIKSPDARGVVNARNWYADRYESILVQRNLLFIVVVLSLVVSVVSIFFVGKVTSQKTIEPMIVEIEEATGITNIVNPLESKSWTASRAVNEYFLMTYLRARETYNVASYVYNYNTIVRLMSSNDVYNNFKRTLNDPTTSPVALYGANNSTVLKIRSIQFLGDTPSGKSVEIRFAVVEQTGEQKSYNKIVSILWDYVQLELNFDDRMVNPLGFQIKSYAVAGERDV